MSGADTKSHEEDVQRDDAPKDQQEEEYHEPWGAQVLRRIHADKTHLLRDYDSLMGPLEHDQVRKFAVGVLGDHDRHLTHLEKLWKKHYSHLKPLDDADEPDEEVGDDETGDDEAPLGDEEVPEEVSSEEYPEQEGTGSDEVPDEEMSEEEGPAQEEEAPPEQDGEMSSEALPADSVEDEPEPEPSAEEAVEGMSRGRDKLNGARTKAMKCACGKNNCACKALTDDEREQSRRCKWGQRNDLTGCKIDPRGPHAKTAGDITRDNARRKHAPPLSQQSHSYGELADTSNPPQLRNPKAKATPKKINPPAVAGGSVLRNKPSGKPLNLQVPLKNRSKVWFQGGRVSKAAPGSEEWIEEERQEPEHQNDFDERDRCSIVDSTNFLGELSQPQSLFDDEHRMKAYHYHKTLDGIVSLRRAHCELADNESNVPPANWKPGAGAKSNRATQLRPEPPETDIRTAAPSTRYYGEAAQPIRTRGVSSGRFGTELSPVDPSESMRESARVAARRDREERDRHFTAQRAQGEREVQRDAYEDALALEADRLLRQSNEKIAPLAAAAMGGGGAAGGAAAGAGAAGGAAGGASGGMGAMEAMQIAQMAQSDDDKSLAGLDLLGATSKWLKELSYCKNFGDPHREKSLAFHKELSEMTKDWLRDAQERDGAGAQDGAQDGAAYEPGQMDTKSLHSVYDSQFQQISELTKILEAIKI